MRALAAAKVKYPDFLKAVDRIYKDPDAKWDKSICYCPVGLGVTYAVDLAGLDSPTLAERGEIIRTGVTLAILASWRKAKSIYVLDKDLEEELFKTSAKDMTVAPGMLTIPARHPVYYQSPALPFRYQHGGKAGQQTLFPATGKNQRHAPGSCCLLRRGTDWLQD